MWVKVSIKSYEQIEIWEIVIYFKFLHIFIPHFILTNINLQYKHKITSDGKCIIFAAWSQKCDENLRTIPIVKNKYV